DLDHVLERAQLANAAHHLDPERHRPSFLLQPLAQLTELLADRVDRLLPRPSEEEPRVEDHELRPGRDRDPRRVVEHPARHVQFLAPLRVTHEPGDRGVHAQHDVAVPAERSEGLRIPVVHPETALEVDLAGRVPVLEQGRDGGLRRLACRDPRRAEMKSRRHGTEAQRNERVSVRRRSYPSSMPSHPSRIDLLELDIDLRLADLWRQAAGIHEWWRDVGAACMRAAYGKGCCGALTEESPGALCSEHGYRVPGRRPQPAPADA